VSEPMTPAAFERLYRKVRDPWGYESSDYERLKYDATVAACGPGPFDNALELGASIGVFTARLAARCRSLVTIDAAPTAVDVARARLAGHQHLDIRVGTIPEAVPQQAYDLIVASEILYYLDPERLERTLPLLAELLVRGGRLIAVHWRPPGPERPFTGEEVHARLRREPWLTNVQADGTDDYLLDVMERA
jgi:SAM-dependent methyltransferase